MYKKDLPSLDLLRKLFRYDSVSGKLYWRERTPDMFTNEKKLAVKFSKLWNTRYADKPCGYYRNGYLNTAIFGKEYFVHRIVWAIHTNKKLSDYEIDHINGKRDDNRIINLRIVNKNQQNKNLSVRNDNTSGIKGVSYDKNRKQWEAKIQSDNKKIFLGRFKIIEDAIAARKQAEQKYFGEYSRA
jgi:hypothetical protein